MLRPRHSVSIKDKSGPKKCDSDRVSLGRGGLTLSVSPPPSLSLSYRLPNMLHLLGVNLPDRKVITYGACQQLFLFADEDADIT